MGPGVKRRERQDDQTHYLFDRGAAAEKAIKKCRRVPRNVGAYASVESLSPEQAPRQSRLVIGLMACE
jgi:hypothetical protein